MGAISPARFWGALALLAAGAVAVVLFVGADTTTSHHVVLRVEEAAGVIKGQYVKEGGANVGTVDGVRTIDGGRGARIELELDDTAWPLPHGTRFVLRQGGTVSAFNKHIRIDRAADDGAVLREGQEVPRADVVVPVQFDTIATTFDREARAGMRRFLGNAGPALAAGHQGLRRATEVTPDAAEEANFVLVDLGADRRALDTLVRSTANVVDAVQRSEPTFGELLEGAAGTFDAIADEQSAMREGLAQLPTALAQVRADLPRVDRTLSAGGLLADRIKLGVAELRRTSGPLSSLLGQLQAVAPSAIQTLNTARAATPDINRLLARATGISPRLQSVATKANTELDCLRPYTPELNGLTTTWGDFLSWDDGKDKVARAQIQAYVPGFTNNQSYSPAQASKLFPGLRYGFPRPPGYNAGQPWFLKRCGAGRDALDPAQDQEFNYYQDTPAVRSVP